MVASKLNYSFNDDFNFIETIIYNKMQFDIYDHPTHGMVFVYINTETGLFKEIVYGSNDQYFYPTIEELSYYFDTHKAVETYLELCRHELEEQNKYLERIECYE